MNRIIITLTTDADVMHINSLMNILLKNLKVEMSLLYKSIKIEDDVAVAEYTIQKGKERQAMNRIIITLTTDADVMHINSLMNILLKNLKVEMSLLYKSIKIEDDVAVAEYTIQKGK